MKQLDSVQLSSHFFDPDNFFLAPFDSTKYMFTHNYPHTAKEYG